MKAAPSLSMYRRLRSQETPPEPQVPISRRECSALAESECTPAERAHVDRADLQASAAMVRYARGERRAFIEVHALLAPRLHRLCSHLLRGADADELVQEVFLKMHRARATFMEGGSVTAWSYAIARTTCCDVRRYRRRRPEEAAEPAWIDRYPARALGCPESTSRGRALERRAGAELARRSETLRSAYVLVKIDGLSCAEAGVVLAASPVAVKQRVHRASEELKSALIAAGW